MPRSYLFFYICLSFFLPFGSFAQNDTLNSSRITTENQSPKKEASSVNKERPVALSRINALDNQIAETKNSSDDFQKKVNEENSLSKKIQFASLVFLLFLISLLSWSFLKKISKMNQKLAKFEKNIKDQAFQISQLRLDTIPSKRATMPEPPTQESNSVVGVNPVLEALRPNPIPHTHLYFGGPSNDGHFLVEHQENSKVPNRSLFDFALVQNDSTDAEYTPIANEFTASTIVNNRVLFENVCDFQNFNQQANGLKVLRRGKAELSDGKWIVIKKTLIEFL